MEIINRERTRNRRWSIQGQGTEILLVLEDDHGRSVAVISPDGARKMAGALNQAALEITRREVMRRGDIVGKIQ